MMTEKENYRRRHGFNAIELVVVTFVIFILIGLVLVFFRSPQKVRDGDQAYSVNNLKILAGFHQLQFPAQEIASCL